MPTEAEQLAEQKRADARRARRYADDVRARLQPAIDKARLIYVKTSDPMTRVDQERNIAQWNAEIHQAEQGAAERERDAGMVVQQPGPPPPGVSPGQLRQYENAQPVAPAPPARQAGPQVSETLDRARDLQRKLNALGAGLVVDGIIGPRTRAAMAKYGMDANGNRTGGGPAAPAGGGGPAPGGPRAAEAPATAPPGSVEDQIRQKYGYLAWALDLPEVGAVLRRAATEGWDEARLRGAVEQTAWWRNSSASMRQWQQQQAEDPATANAKIQAQTDYIRSQSGVFGITIDPARASAIAADSLKYGWSGTQLQSAILNEFHYVKGQTAGRSAEAEQQFKQMAGDYLIPLDDATIARWVEQAVKQQQDPESFKHYLIDQAKSLFPGLAAALDQGLTTKQLAAPYRNVAADELGVGGDTIDFRDPKWARALNFSDPKTGQFRPMDLYQWQRTIRGDSVYGWSKGAKANQMADDFSLGLLQAMGRAPN